ncbi:MAG TPA: MBL fold metallo-hydrolase [Methylomirabilota bacterium]
MLANLVMGADGRRGGGPGGRVRTVLATWAWCAAGAGIAVGAWWQEPGAPRVIPEVRYVANAGMLVAIGEQRVLIDAPIREGIPPYATSPPDERGRLERAHVPYDQVDAILITHWHEDHFSPDAVAAHLSSSPGTVLVSSPEVVDRLRAAAPSLDAARLHAVLPPPGRSELRRVGDLRVHVLRIRHNPARRQPEQHVGFFVEGAATVLHVGDADPEADNFTVLQELPQVDVALLPYWYLLTDASRRMVAGAIAPGRIVAMHMPAGEAADVRRALEQVRVPSALPTEPGTPVTW